MGNSTTRFLSLRSEIDDKSDDWTRNKKRDNLPNEKSRRKTTHAEKK